MLSERRHSNSPDGEPGRKESVVGFYTDKKTGTCSDKEAKENSDCYGLRGEKEMDKRRVSLVLVFVMIISVIRPYVWYGEMRHKKR